MKWERGKARDSEALQQEPRGKKGERQTVRHNTT